MTRAQEKGYTGPWPYQEFNVNDKEIYCENQRGGWYIREYNSMGRETYYESSDGYWCKRWYAENGIECRYEASDGVIVETSYGEGCKITKRHKYGGWIQDTLYHNLNLVTMLDSFGDIKKRAKNFEEAAAEAMVKQISDDIDKEILDKILALGKKK